MKKILMLMRAMCEKDDSTKRMMLKGEAGFPGPHLCERLHKDGHETLRVDNSPITCGI